MQNYSKQETGERLHDSTPLGATEFPLNMQTGRRNRQEDREINYSERGRESEYIIASEDASSKIHHSLALVAEPTL